MYNENDNHDHEEWEEDEQEPNLPVQEEHKNKGWKIAGVVAVIILILLLLARCMGGNSGNSTTNDDPNNPNSDIQTGTIDVTGDVNSRDLQMEVNKAVEEGMFNVFINTQVYLDNGKSEANLLIQNSRSNKKSVIVELYLKDSDEMIFQSDAIPAGSKLEKAKLDKTLEKGTYPCVAYFNVLNPETKEMINRIGVNVQVEVAA